TDTEAPGSGGDVVPLKLAVPIPPGIGTELGQVSVTASGAWTATEQLAALPTTRATTTCHDPAIAAVGEIASMPSAPISDSCVVGAWPGGVTVTVTAASARPDTCTPSGWPSSTAVGQATVGAALAA